MNRSELASIVRCRLESEPDVPGGQILAELLESIGRLPGEELRIRKMTCDAIVSAYLTQSAQPPSRHVATERKRIKKFSTMEALIDRIQSSKKILAIVGAGASTSAGLPDFRSQGGLYDQIKADYGEQFDDPRLLFDAAQFKLDPGPFFRVAHRLLQPPGNKPPGPTPCHRFLARMEEMDKLLRCYTQNVDGLEVKAGMTRVVHCHGTLSTSTCTSCSSTFPTQVQGPDTIPKCPTNDGGILKPDIVFFGQDLPMDYKKNVERDVRDADLVMIFGSSLKVYPVASLVTRFPPRVPIVLINREVVGRPNEFDIEMLGDCDTIVQELERLLDWDDDDDDEEEVDQRPKTRAIEAIQYDYLPPNRYLFPNVSIDPEERRRRLAEGSPGPESNKRSRGTHSETPSNGD